MRSINILVTEVDIETMRRVLTMEEEAEEEEGQKEN